MNALSQGFIKTPIMGIAGASANERAEFEKERNAITHMGWNSAPDVVA